MFDAAIRRLIARPVDRTGAALARGGLTADQVTIAGLVLGLACALAIALAAPAWVALALLALGRLADGLDGAVARATRLTDRGGFLDIVCDFVFYGAVPLAFAWREPQNAWPAACLLFAFYINGASFLAFAVLAAKRGLETESHGRKSLYFTAGLTEGAETIAVFAAMILWPAGFPWLAGVFAVLCLVTAVSRALIAWSRFAVDDPAEPGPSALERASGSATPSGPGRGGRERS
jgi:phosphatidylglycerophosphate synthase